VPQSVENPSIYICPLTFCFDLLISVFPTGYFSSFLPNVVNMFELEIEYIGLQWCPFLHGGLYLRFCLWGNKTKQKQL